MDHRDLLDPKTLLGAAVWAAMFLAGAAILGAAIRAGARRLEPRLSDITGLRFSSAFLQALTYLLAFILYADLVPGLRALGTALLAGVSVVSIVLAWLPKTRSATLSRDFRWSSTGRFVSATPCSSVRRKASSRPPSKRFPLDIRCFATRTPRR